MSLSHANIETVVRQRYIKSLGSDQEYNVHRLIAGMLHIITHANLISSDSKLLRKRTL